MLKLIQDLIFDLIIDLLFEEEQLEAIKPDDSFLILLI